MFVSVKLIKFSLSKGYSNWYWKKSSLIVGSSILGHNFVANSMGQFQV